jgi:hypothetical protein
MTAKAARTTIVAESEFFLLPRYSQHPGNMPVVITTHYVQEASMDDSTSSSFGASRRTTSERRGISSFANNKPNKERLVCDGIASSTPRLRSRTEGEYALLSDESLSENISGEEKRKPAKMGIVKRLADRHTHSDPYRNPPAAPLQFAVPLARALPSPPGNARSARPDKRPHPLKFALTMSHLNENKPDGDRLDNEEFIGVVRKQILTGNRRDNGWMIKSIFGHQDYAQYSMDSKCETLMGNTSHIYSGTVPVQEQRDYYEAVEQMYETSTPGPHRQEIDLLRGQLEKLVAGEEQTTLRNRLLRDMMWTLTPNQRDTLRQAFPLLYGDHTVADDINWLYFDTVIRLYSKSDLSQQKWMQSITAASKETRIEARDEFMGIIHSRLSPAQRNELKAICKKRHDDLLSSREPLLHTAIRTKNENAARAYVTNVLEFAPPEQRERLLLARSDTADGKETGDAAFFRLLHSGSESMIMGFVSVILRSTQLTLEQKWNILDARRPQDNVSAFTMLMGMGDWPRIRAFVHTLTGWNFDDFHDLKNPIEPMTVDIPGVALAKNVRTYLFKIMLLEGWRRKEWEYGARTTAYAVAMENGHKKCARRLFKLLLSIKQYLILERLSVVSYYPPKKPKRIAKDAAMFAELSKKENDRRRAMTLAERKKEDESEEREYEASMKVLNSMPSVEELFADEVKEIMMLEDDKEKDRAHFAALRMQDKLKAAERKKKLKSLFEPLSSKKPLPGSPGARSLTSRYSFNRTSPTKSPSPRARSMPNIPSMPKFSSKSNSTQYTALPDGSEGG